MNLTDALTLIATRFNLDPQALIDFAAEDNTGGWDYDERLYGWAVGSLHSVEGKVLYALVRALRPLLCLEIGTWHGCSASHILAALVANGDGGRLACVDNGGFGNVRIAPHLLDSVDFVGMDLFEFIKANATDGVRFDFIFEDAFHTSDQVEFIWDAAAHETLLAPGGVIVSHDAMHHIVGDDVQSGISAAGVTDVVSVMIEPADCGLAVWRKGDEPIEAFEGSAEDYVEEKPKRKPASKKKAAK